MIKILLRIACEIITGHMPGKEIEVLEIVTTSNGMAWKFCVKYECHYCGEEFIAYHSLPSF